MDRQTNHTYVVVVVVVKKSLCVHDDEKKRFLSLETCWFRKKVIFGVRIWITFSTFFYSFFFLNFFFSFGALKVLMYDRNSIENESCSFTRTDDSPW